MAGCGAGALLQNHRKKCKNRGVFITFEGPEGAGKSTVIGEVATHLTNAGHDILCTREPGSGEIGAKIREILLHGEAMVPKCELFLFLADRAQHVEGIIRPALAEGKIVLCDRYCDSTVVYQGVARGLDPKIAKEFNAFATGGLVPDLTLLLDVPADIGQSRVKDRDRLDNEPLEFHEKVRASFLDEARLDPERWTVIDASKPIDQVIDQCLRAIQSRIARSGRE